MASHSTLARPYAKAVFELARDAGDFAAWGEALAALKRGLADPVLSARVRSPALTRADLAAALAQALSAAKFPAEAVTLVRLLVENGRLAAVPEIAAQFEALRAEHESRAEVRITSAAEIPSQQREALTSAVSKRLARTVSIEWTTDEALIAGALIRAGDLVIDGSVRGELNRLQTALTR